MSESLFNPLQSPPGPPEFPEATPQERQMVLFLHLSTLLGFLIPVAGLVVPIVLWMTQKDRSAYVNEAGKHVMNFIISMFIYTFVLAITVVGLMLIWIPVIVAVVLPILGAVASNEGRVYRYPLMLNLIK